MTSAVYICLYHPREKSKLLTANMATPTEAEKYEVLETIGTCSAILLYTVKLSLTMHPGRGSFGIIRKVRRASDGHV